MGLRFRLISFKKNRFWLVDTLERGMGVRKKRPKDALHEKIDLRVFPKGFHGSCYHHESGHNKLAGRMKYMANTADELSVVSNVSIHL